MAAARPHLALTVAVLVALVACGAGQGLLLLHDGAGSALAARSQQGEAATAVSPAAATAALCATSGLVPPYAVDGVAAQAVAGLMQPGALHAPAPMALVLLHLAGVDADSAAVARVKQAWGARGHTAHLQLTGASPGSLLQAAGDVVAANKAAASLSLLDHTALGAGCATGSCLLQHLEAAVRHCGGKHHAPAPATDGAPQAAAAAAGVLAGSLQLPGVDDAHLDLSLPAARLFALELAGLAGSAQQAAARAKQQQQQQGPALAVFEATSVSLQALAASLPAGSPLLAGAEAALGGVLAHVLGQLQDAFGSDVVYQVALLGKAPVASGSAAHLMDWSQLSRRTLLEASGGHTPDLVAGELDAAGPAAALRGRTAVGADAAAASKRYAQKATAYGVTLLLLWFVGAGLHCMVGMRFKEDSLLYGRSKAD